MIWKRSTLKLVNNYIVNCFHAGAPSYTGRSGLWAAFGFVLFLFRQKQFGFTHYCVPFLTFVNLKTQTWPIFNTNWLANLKSNLSLNRLSDVFVDTGHWASFVEERWKEGQRAGRKRRCTNNVSKKC